MAGLALKKTNLAEQAYGVIREMLLEGGRFLPGDKISVEELTRELAVSRSPVWAAINRLAAEGIVEVRPRDGVFFAGFDPGRLRDLYAVREELEAMAVRLAAEAGLSQSGAAGLCASLERQRAAMAAGDADSYSRESMVFHGLLAEASGNAVLAEMLHQLLSRIRGMCVAINRASVTLDRQFAEHAAIVEAILGGAAEAADHAVRGHIRSLAAKVGSPVGDASLERRA